MALRAYCVAVGSMLKYRPALEHLGAEHRPAFAAAPRGERGHPPEVVGAYELGEAVVGLLLLHLQHLGHVAVGAAKLQFPVHEPPVGVHPVGVRAAPGYLAGQRGELLLVAALRHLGEYFVAVDVLLQRQENLVRVHRFYQVVGYLRADGLVHYVLLFALGDHHHRHGGQDVLNLLERLKAAQAGHHLVEQHEVEVVFAALVDCVGAVGHRHHLVSLLFEEKQVGPEKLYLVVGPK